MIKITQTPFVLKKSPSLNAIHKGFPRIPKVCPNFAIIFSFDLNEF